jgi:hypothetical protein
MSGALLGSAQRCQSMSAAPKVGRRWFVRQGLEFGARGKVIARTSSALKRSFGTTLDPKQGERMTVAALTAVTQ